VRAEGPDHSKQFFATVSIGGEERGRGEGRSKKQAEQAAARAAWEQLDVDALATVGQSVGGSSDDA
jgi:ribonuclease-3